MKQLAVVPIKHRKLVGSCLVKEFVRRLPYGVKLVSCWTAQDLTANYFFEAIGMIPIAFRTGSRGRRRVHIFWQRRVREGDTTTPFWFPKMTRGGSIAEERIILPIPPGYSWKDEFPVILPEVSIEGQRLLPNGLPDPRFEKQLPKSAPQGPVSPAERLAQIKERSKVIQKAPKGMVRLMTSGGAKHIPTDDYIPPPKQERPKKKRAKAEPKHITAARELRDRFLDAFNNAGIVEAGKYTPARQLDDAPSALGELPGGAAEAQSRPALPERGDEADG